MRQIRILSSAQTDLVQIQAYTFEVWGAEQVEELQKELKKVWFRIAVSPFIGRKTNKDGVFACALGRLPFVLLYQVDDTYVYVVAVIHTKRKR